MCGDAGICVSHRWFFLCHSGSSLSLDRSSMHATSSKSSTLALRLRSTSWSLLVQPCQGWRFDRIWHDSVEHSTFAEALKQFVQDHHRFTNVPDEIRLGCETGAVFDPALRPTASPAKLVAELERRLFSCETCGLLCEPVGSVQPCTVCRHR